MLVPSVSFRAGVLPADHEGHVCLDGVGLQVWLSRAGVLIRYPTQYKREGQPLVVLGWPVLLPFDGCLQLLSTRSPQLMSNRVTGSQLPCGETVLSPLASLVVTAKFDVSFKVILN